MKIIYVHCGEEMDVRLILAATNTTEWVVKIRLKKKFRPIRDLQPLLRGQLWETTTTRQNSMHFLTETCVWNKCDLLYGDVILSWTHTFIDVMTHEIKLYKKSQVIHTFFKHHHTSFKSVISSVIQSVYITPFFFSKLLSSSILKEMFFLILSRKVFVFRFCPVCITVTSGPSVQEWTWLNA